MNYARIQDGAVVELFETNANIASIFHPDLIWAEAPAGTQEGDIFQDGEFSRPDPVEPPHVVPSQVTPAQGLMALFVLKDITEDDILAAIDGIEDATMRYQAQIAYKKATTWDRASITMQTLAGLLGLTEADLDELFTLAATYTNL